MIKRLKSFNKTLAFIIAAIMIISSLVFTGSTETLASEDWRLVLVEPGTQEAGSGQTLQFSAAVVSSDGKTMKNPNVKWSVEGFFNYGDVPVCNGTSINADGMLIIGAEEVVPGLTVTAEYIGGDSVKYIGTALVRLAENEAEEELYSEEELCGGEEYVEAVSFEAASRAVDLNQAGVYTYAQGNIARHPDVIQSIPTGSSAASINRVYNANNPPVGITASYSSTSNAANDRFFASMNNALLVGESATGQINAGYNSYGFNSGPVYTVLRWNETYTIDSTRVMWWYDGTTSTSGVTLPSAGSGANVTTLQWWNGSSWVSVTNLRNAAGAGVSNIGVAGNGTGGANRTWNGVTFDPITTDRVRLMIQKGLGNGVGVGEWEVFAQAGDPELRSVAIDGIPGMIIGEEKDFSARVSDNGLPGLEYKWTVDNSAIAEIVGADNGASVRLKGIGGGSTALRVTVKHDTGVQEASAGLNITVVGPISGVAISPAHAFVAPGSTGTPFTASAITTVPYLKGVTWSILGTAIPGVSIDSQTGVITVSGNIAEGTRFTVRAWAAAVYNDSFFADATVTVADLPGDASPNGYYNSVHRHPYTGSVYANNAVIAEMKSSGVWGRGTTNGSVTGGTNYDWTTTNNRYGTDTRYVYEGGYGNGDAMYLGNENTGSNYRFISGASADAHFSVYDSNGNVDASYADIDFTCGMYVPANQSGSLVFRYQNWENYYYLKVTPSGPEDSRITVGKVADGVDTVLHSNNGTAAAATWYNWRIRLVGNTLRVWRHTNFRWQQRWTAQGDNVSFAAGAVIFNNVVLDSAETFKKGKAGLWAVNGGGALFSHIAIGSLDNNYKLKGDIWTLTTGANGNIKQLTAENLKRGDSATTAAAALRDDPNGALLNIMGNEDINRDEMGFNKFLGELKFAYKKGASDALITAKTGESEDIRRAVYNEEAKRVDFIYDFPSRNDLGIKDFSVVNSYSVKKENDVEFVQYDIVVKNTGAESIEFYDIGMPITWNNHWQGDSAYKFNLNGANNYISYHGSYITLERNEGGSQKIVFMPDQSTDAKIEYRRYQFVGNESNMPEEFFIYSKGVANRAPKAAWVNNNYNPDQSYLPNTSSGIVAPGEERKYSFRIFITGARNHLEIDDILVSQGSVAAVVNPGMITPISQDTQVNLRTINKITKIEDITPEPDPRNGVQKRTGVPNPIEGWYAYNGNPRAIVTWNAAKTAEVNAQNGNQEANIYDIRFRKQGRNDIKVYYEAEGKERWTVLQFWVTADVTEAIQMRASFLLEKSFVSDEFYDDYLAGGERRAALNAAPDSHYNTEHGIAFVRRHKYAFLEANNIFGYVRGHNGDNYYCTNSVHEQHVDNIAFLANKNVNYPVYEEMKAMELGFIDHFYNLQVRNFGSVQSTGAGSAGQEGTLWAGCGCYAGNYWGSTGTTAATSRITRGYNYQNLAAAYWSMYEATRRNPSVLGDEARWEPVDYLKVAAILAYRGMFIDNAPAGHMNDWALQGIYEGLLREIALGNEGTVADPSNVSGRTYRSCANLLALFSAQATTRGNNFFNAAYPFSSEFAYDQTGEEGSYTLVKWHASNGGEGAAISRLDKIAFIIGKAVAWTGKTPIWHKQAMGNVAGSEHWMYKYSVGHHSQILDDFFFNHADEDIYMTRGVDKYEGDGNKQFSQDMWRFVYPMKMAIGGWIFTGQPELHGPTGPNSANPTGGLVNKNPMKDGLGILGSVMGAMRSARPYDWSLTDVYGFNYNGFPFTESAEADEGIWACLNSLSADVVPNDPNFGLTGWGALVSDAGKAYKITPTDGLYRKLKIVGDKFQAEFINDRYTEAVINKDYTAVKFELENVSGKAHTGAVNLRMLQPGVYYVFVDGKQQRTVEVPAHTGAALDRYGNVLPVEFTYDAGGAKTFTLEIMDSTPVTSLKIDANVTATVERGKVYKFGLILNEGATGENVVWTVSDPSFALIDDESNVYILNKTGTVRLIATDQVSGLWHSIVLRIAS